MSVEEEKIAMELFLLARKARVFAVVTCAMLACGCQNGAHSPIAPSLTSAASPAESASSGVMPGDEFTTQDAPVSYPINEVIATGSSSGYSGTCTVSNTHTGAIRVKVDGRGLAYSLVVFNVVDLSDPLHLRTTEYVDVNQQGTFRTNWQSIEPGLFTVGGDLQCWLTSSVNGSTLASSSTFPAP
jgi:hypothetical protein